LLGQVGATGLGNPAANLFQEAGKSLSCISKHRRFLPSARLRQRNCTLVNCLLCNCDGKWQFAWNKPQYKAKIYSDFGPMVLPVQWRFPPSFGSSRRWAGWICIV